MNPKSSMLMQGKPFPTIEGHSLWEVERNHDTDLTVVINKSITTYKNGC
jgi:hypothetical protein